MIGPMGWDAHDLHYSDPPIFLKVHRIPINRVLQAPIHLDQEGLIDGFSMEYSISGDVFAQTPCLRSNEEEEGVGTLFLDVLDQMSSELFPHQSMGTLSSTGPGHRHEEDPLRGP